MKPTLNIRNEHLEPQSWIHFVSKPIYTPHPELRREAVNGAQLPTEEAGKGGTLCRSALAASARPLARTPRTKLKRRRNKADLLVQRCSQASP